VKKPETVFKDLIKNYQSDRGVILLSENGYVKAINKFTGIEHIFVNDKKAIKIPPGINLSELGIIEK